MFIAHKHFVCLFLVVIAALYVVMHVSKVVQVLSRLSVLQVCIRTMIPYGRKLYKKKGEVLTQNLSVPQQCNRSFSTLLTSLLELCNKLTILNKNEFASFCFALIKIMVFQKRPGQRFKQTQVRISLFRFLFFFEIKYDFPKTAKFGI